MFCSKDGTETGFSHFPRLLLRAVAAMFLWLALVGHVLPAAGFSCDAAQDESTLIQKLPGLKIQHQSMLSLEDATRASADLVHDAPQK